jgi:predicted ATPase with chaperone activity
LDRINLHVEVSWPKSFLLQHEGPTPESSEQVRSRVIAARAIQEQRAGCTNAHLESAGLMLDVWQALLARAFALRCLRLPKLGQTRKLLHGDLPAGQEALKAATARP